MGKDLTRHVWHILFGVVFFWFVLIVFSLLGGLFGINPVDTVSWRGYVFLACSAFIAGYVLAFLPQWRIWESLVIGALLMIVVIFTHALFGDIERIDFRLTFLALIAMCVPMCFGSYGNHWLKVGKASE